MPEWYVCSLNRAGILAEEYTSRFPAPTVNLTMTDTADPPAFQDEWFISVASVQDQVLAVALGAVSTRSQVNGYLDLPSEEGGEWFPGVCYGLEVMLTRT